MRPPWRRRTATKRLSSAAKIRALKLVFRRVLSTLLELGTLMQKTRRSRPRGLSWLMTPWTETKTLNCYIDPLKQWSEKATAKYRKEEDDGDNGSLLSQFDLL